MKPKADCKLPSPCTKMKLSLCSASSEADVPWIYNFSQPPGLRSAFSARSNVTETAVTALYIQNMLAAVGKLEVVLTPARSTRYWARVFVYSWASVLFTLC